MAQVIEKFPDPLVPFRCPACGREEPRNVSWLMTNQLWTCRGCDTEWVKDGDNLYTIKIKAMLEVGDVARCSQCRELSAVKYRTTFNNSRFNFKLECGHENAWCTRCHELVMEGTDSSSYTVPICSPCIERQEG